MEKLKHSESVQDPANQTQNATGLELPSANRNNKMRSTWKGFKSDRFNITKRMSVNSPDPHQTNAFNVSSAYKFAQDDEDDVVYMRMSKYEDKMRSHDERLAYEQQKIIDSCKNHSFHVDNTKSLYDNMMKKRYEDSFMRTVNKQLKTKTQIEKRDKTVAETVVEQLQEKHRANQEKLRQQQEEERRQFKERFQKLHQTIRKNEEKLTNQRMEANELMTTKIEKKRLLFDSQMDNDRRLKMMRHNFHTVMMTKHQMKEKKLGDVKRIMINHHKEPIQALYGTLHGQ